MFNEYSFIRIYTNLALQKAEDRELEDLYFFLKDRGIESPELKHHFDLPKPMRLEHAIAIDAVAHAIHQGGEELLKHIFPNAKYTVMKAALDELAGAETWNDVRKLNRGYFTSLLTEDEGISFLEKATVGRTTKEDIGDAIGEYQKLYKISMASPAEILTLSRYFPDNAEYQKAVIESNLDDESVSMVVGGPASVEMIDKQGHLITTEALEKAFEGFIKNFRTRNVNVLHSNVQCGWALPAYINDAGEIFKSGVDEKGLWLVAELRDDITIAKRVKEEINKGRLRSYSIAGSATKMQNMQKGSQSFTQVDELQLAEITLCEQGVNQGAHFSILKTMDSMPSYLQNVITDDEIIKSISPQDSLFESWAVVLEKGENGTVIVICADKPNSLTDGLFTELRKAIPPTVAIEVRNVPLGEWSPLVTLNTMNVQKQDAENISVKAHYRPGRTNNLCGDCVFFSAGFCTKLQFDVAQNYTCDYFKEEIKKSMDEVPYWSDEDSGKLMKNAGREIEKLEDSSLTATDKLVGFVTMGIGKNRVVVPGFNFIKGERTMADDTKLKDFLQWEKTEKERQKINKDLLAAKGIPSKDKDYDVDYAPDNAHDDDDEVMAKKLAAKNIQNPSEG
tara:strand:+ start:4110 stop:5969 length:1860 start_codon:yes stop_codon:yes gene_type:complete